MNTYTRCAVGLAIAAAFGTTAQAFPRTDYAAATKIYFGGATATDNTLEEAFIAAGAGCICDTTIGGIDVWRASNQRVVTCTVSNDQTPGHGFPTRAAGGLKVAFHKESAGGSSNGVNPLIAVSKGQAHSLRWLDVGSLANDCTVTSVAATASLAAYTDHSSCTLVQTPADVAGASAYDAHGGISDVEPGLSYPSPGADASRLLANPGLAIVFGVPVTKALYRALQVAQFGDGSACDGSDLATCVPSMSKDQIRALYTQNIVDWSEFKDAAGNALTGLTGVTAPADNYVRICRRVATSGTQASFETFFLNQRCATVAAVFAEPDGDGSGITDTSYHASDFASGYLVNAAPSSGNVRTCLQAANTGNYWGVGVLSTEVTASNLSGAGDSFRFIGIDGAAPTLANVANGDYDFFTENTVNRVNSGTGVLADGDARREVIELIDERLSAPARLVAINATFTGRPWGNGGMLGLSINATSNTAPYSDAELAASPVNTQSRFGNNCTPPVMIKASPVP
jgi:hypothetical protein